MLVAGEKWVPFSEHGGYAVSSAGRVVSFLGRMPRQMKLTQDRDGYLMFKFRVHGRLRTRKIHRVVLSEFYRKGKKGETCNHKNGDKQDNRIANLEWVPIRENIRHAIQNRLIVINKGEASNLAKLTSEAVESIRALRKVGKADKEIAAAFGVHVQTIRRIFRGQTWSACS